MQILVHKKLLTTVKPAVLFALMTVTTLPAFSQTDATETIAPELKALIPTLVASPGICELNSGQTQCEMTTTLIWEVPKAGHFCLREDEGTKLQCWQNKWSGTFQFQFKSGTNRTFILVKGSGQAAGSVVANTTIAVTSTLKQRLRAQRRRSLWRLF